MVAVVTLLFHIAAGAPQGSQAAEAHRTEPGEYPGSVLCVPGEVSVKMWINRNLFLCRIWKYSFSKISARL